MEDNKNPFLKYSPGFRTKSFTTRDSFLITIDFWVQITSEDDWHGYLLMKTYPPNPPFVTIWLQLAHRPARMSWRAFDGYRWIPPFCDECCGCSEHSSKLLTTAIVLFSAKIMPWHPWWASTFQESLYLHPLCRRNLTSLSGHTGFSCS